MLPRLVCLFESDAKNDCRPRKSGRAQYRGFGTGVLPSLVLIFELNFSVQYRGLNMFYWSTAFFSVLLVLILVLALGVVQNRVW